MQATHHMLFHVGLRHDFYTDGVCRDFVMEPTPACRRLLGDYGLIFRHAADGCFVYAEVEAGTVPPQLLRPLGAESLAFRFILRLQNPYFTAFTDLDLGKLDLERDVYCFDNLRDDVAGGSRHLGDDVADARVGDPVQLVAKASYLHALPAPAASGSVVVQDRFGNIVYSELFDYDGAIGTVQVDLSQVDALGPGRLKVTDDQGGAAELYFDPELFGRPAFAIVEIFSRTEDLTIGGTNEVPATNRFLNDDEITGNGVYTVQFAARTTTWKYVVVKKYDTNGIEIDKLQIVGDVAFPGSPTVDTAAGQAVFLSDPTTLREKPRTVTLQQTTGSKDVRDLPNPRADTPLGESNTSPLYVYV